MKGMPIPALGQLIIECWVKAERALRESVRTKFADSDEEFITRMFHGELEGEFAEASRTGAVARAFLSDLRHTFPTIVHGSLLKIAGGLIATVSFHPRRVEGKTGGDLGIVLVRPDVRRAKHLRLELTIEHDYKRGLLCQAKVFRRDSHWGRLSPKQRRIIDGRLAYSALLLYRYVDQDDSRRELAPFAWQLTREAATVEQIGVWLAGDRFPKLQDSRQVLDGLIRDQVGSSDKKLIEQYIAPRLRPSLVITIRWKDDEDPGGRLYVQERFTATNQLQTLVNRSPHRFSGTASRLAQVGRVES